MPPVLSEIFQKVAVKDSSKYVPDVGLSAERWVVKWNTIKALQF